MVTVYRNKFYVAAGDANAQQELAMPILVEKLIDIATMHANSLHIGNPDMVELKGGWVLSRLSIEMQEWPALDTGYVIETWVEDWNRHFSTRCFSISDKASGRVLGYARSIWMIMHKETHENLGLAHFSLPAEVMTTGRECPIARQSKHHAVEPEEGCEVPRYRFKYCDIDNYRHVNTVRYVQLLLNQFGMEKYDTSILDRMELSFLHEASYGMTVAIASRKTDETTTALTLSDVTDATARPLLYARMRFIPRH